jgi:hypothetical protein
MSQSDPFITFPISALRMPVSPAAVTADEATVRAGELRLLSVVTGMDHLHRKHDLNAVEAMADAYLLTQEHYPDWLTSMPLLAACLGVHHIGAECLSVFRNEENFHKATCGLRARLVSDVGRKLVRMRMDFVCDLEEQSLSFREFAVSAAVYGCLSGTHCKAQRLTRAQLRAMASGFGGHRIATAHNAEQSLFLTEKQLRVTLNTLEDAGVFVRVSLGRRAYFSHSMTQTQLERYVATVEVSRLQKRASRNATEASQRVRGEIARRAETRAERGAATGKTSSGKPSSGKTTGRIISDEMTAAPSVPFGQYIATHNENTPVIGATSTVVSDTEQDHQRDPSRLRRVGGQPR